RMDHRRPWRRSRHHRHRRPFPHVQRRGSATRPRRDRSHEIAAQKSTGAGEEAQVSAARGAVARLVFRVEYSVKRLAGIESMEKKPAKWAFPIVTDLA